MYTSISFFEFTPLSPEAVPSIVATAQRCLSEFNARGTLIIAKEGFNGQFTIDQSKLSLFSLCLSNIHPTLQNIELNIGKTDRYSEQDLPFKKLIVKQKNQILTDNYNQQLNFQQDYGMEASAEEWHSMVKHNKSNALIIDCRNEYESDVGTFSGAIPLNTTIFSESWDALDRLLEDVPRDQTILTFCTGGIRCRKTNAYIRQKKGYENVISLKHGIIAYDRWLCGRGKREGGGVDFVQRDVDHWQTRHEGVGVEAREQGEESAFVGKNFVFDRSRMRGGTMD